MGSAILNAVPFRASLRRFMPHRQPLPFTFINRAVNRYHVNALADRFVSFLLFRFPMNSIGPVMFVTWLRAAIRDPSCCPLTARRPVTRRLLLLS